MQGKDQLDAGVSNIITPPLVDNFCACLVKTVSLCKSQTTAVHYSVHRLMALYDNYEEDVSRREDRTRQERREEEQFLTEIINTQTMQETIKFLRNKKLWKKSDSEFKKKLSELWFENYSRGGRILSSSGFEHLFLGEKKNGKVLGFHNWVYFYHMEATNKVLRLLSNLYR